jgi:hypothetical protein
MRCDFNCAFTTYATERNAMHGRYLPVTGRTFSIRCLVLLASLVCVAIQPALAADTALQARIEFEVQREQRLEGTAVQIFTDAGHVVMTGHVRLLSQKLLYEQIAWQARGAVDVDSEIRVIPHTRASDRQLKESILALARDQKQLPVIDVVVKDGVVIVHGAFTRASEVLLLKWRIAEIEGVVRILIDSQFLAQGRMPAS